ncbi:MAG: class I SAM-dependent methyltransferase [Chthoniobacterales bacterium]
MTESIYFDKYDVRGAYHWVECDRSYANWKRYNPTLEARYDLTVRAIRELGVCGRLLDVGCGDGYLMSRVAPMMESVVGVDSEESAIRLARQKLHKFINCKVTATTGYDLPFLERSFDVVVLGDVIEHLKEPAHHLKEIGRVLQPGGALVLTTPKWRADRKWDIRHEKEYRTEELRTLLAEFFDRVDTRYFWPLSWSRFYATRVGWRLLKLVALTVRNPFLSMSESKPDQFGQILAVCRNPRQTECHPERPKI